ncbi:hypothetical protein BJ741DRAFT_580831 [Chytriomyces cf. hyalinus JEL632]|nr:hypothetical protein BJ741DRAFT_580831 [Chytriomyces cf. hyalinus JEL632]
MTAFGSVTAAVLGHPTHTPNTRGGILNNHLFKNEQTASELRNAKPTIVDPSVPVPKTFFDIPLRAFMLVFLALFAIMEIAGIGQSIPFAWRYSIFWWYIA